MSTREVRLFPDWSFVYILCILVYGYHIYVLGRYERLQGQRRNDVEPSAGKLVMMDVFLAPRFPEIVCIVVGNGLQITCTALVIGSFFDVIYLTSSIPPGISALTCMIFILLIFQHRWGLCGYMDVEHLQRRCKGLDIHLIRSGLLVPRLCFHASYSPQRYVLVK